jgi:hypothetical protein
VLTLKSILLTAAVAPALFAQSAPVVDRGLPKVNLNNASGPVRSNVRWGWHQQGFMGDDFTIGVPGERWVIESIRTWAVPGTRDRRPTRLGEVFQDVRLYFGSSSRDLTPVAAGDLSDSTDETSNTNIRITEATQNGEIGYDDSGASLRVWQVDFRGLELKVNGGERYRFGVWGLGRQIPGEDGKRFMWYNHASNAELSGATQDSADGAMILFDGAGRFEKTFQAKGAGWDKNADINVQVFARRVSSGRGNVNPR